MRPRGRLYKHLATIGGVLTTLAPEEQNPSAERGVVKQRCPGLRLACNRLLLDASEEYLFEHHAGKQAGTASRQHAHARAHASGEAARTS